MRRAVRGLALALALHAPLAAAAPPPAREAERGGAAVAEAARQRVSEGLKHFAKRRYDRALAAFLQAYGLTRNPALLFNLGLTAQKLGDPLRARRWYADFLREATAATPEQRARAEAAIADADAALGAIEIAAPEGADLAVDGEPIGRAPLAGPVPVLPGEHAVTSSTPAGAKLVNVVVKAGATAKARLGPVGPPPPPPSVVSEPAPAPAGPRAAPAAPAPPEAPGLLAPPEAMAPVWVGGVVGVGALGAAMILRGLGANADRNADVAHDALARAGKDANACSGSVDGSLSVTCAALRSSDHVKSTVDGAFLPTLAVGIGASAFALGWYLFAPKSAPRIAGAGGLLFAY